MIDTGTWLTSEDSGRSSSGATLYVEDASYFYDGWGIPGEVGDTIETASGQTAVISSINYSTNTITLTASLTTVDGEGISLSYNGSKPDIGAHEYGEELAPTVTNTTIESNGLSTTINFSKIVITTGYDNGDFDVDCSTAGNNINLNSISGSGTSRTFTLASYVGPGDTCTLDYTGGANEIEDTSGNDLAVFSGESVTNNSGGVAKSGSNIVNSVKIN
jgi:hypothetical protein